MSISCDILGKIQASSANFVHRLLWQLVVTADTWEALGCISQNRGGFLDCNVQSQKVLWKILCKRNKVFKASCLQRLWEQQILLSVGAVQTANSVLLY